MDGDITISKIGTVTFISPTAEISTRTFEFTIEADNSDFTFKSGIPHLVLFNN